MRLRCRRSDLYIVISLKNDVLTISSFSHCLTVTVRHCNGASAVHSPSLGYYCIRTTLDAGLNVLAGLGMVYNMILLFYSLFSILLCVDAGGGYISVHRLRPRIILSKFEMKNAQLPPCDHIMYTC